MRRSIEFRRGRGTFFPLDSRPDFRLGYDYAAGCFSGGGGGPPYPVPAMVATAFVLPYPERHSVRWKSYVWWKQYCCKNFCNVEYNPSAHVGPS